MKEVRMAKWNQETNVSLQTNQGLMNQKAKISFNVQTGFDDMKDTKNRTQQNSISNQMTSYHITWSHQSTSHGRQNIIPKAQIITPY